LLIEDPNISSASVSFSFQMKVEADRQGAICLDILKDAWSPVLTLKSTLISLQSLLCDPAPNDPQDAEGKLTIPHNIRANESVAKHYLTDRASFNKTAKHWAQAYAQAPANKQSREAGKVMTDAEQAGLSEASVVQFTEMGFPREKVVR
jgi:ubiquitin-conjugating enzyme (huntingtin interacting protein 2)